MTKRTVENTSYLLHDWPSRPANVHSCTTLISGGHSKGCFDSFNLAMHVGDDDRAVQANRRKLRRELGLTSEPVWLEQVHSDEVVVIDDALHEKVSEADILTPIADATICRYPGRVCAVLTADCLPVFISDRNGTEVAVAHAGWKGLYAGVVTNTVKKMRSSVASLVVHLGPAIGAGAFEVGDDVLQCFNDRDPANAGAFTPTIDGKYLCDIYQLARTELLKLGIDADSISGGGYCTYTDEHLFYSYRRDNQTGRMANLIWMC